MKIIGRYLEPWEVVHHINEVKLDNRIENLFLTTVQEHSTIHREGRKASLEKKTAQRQKTRAKDNENPRPRVNGKFVKKESN